MLRPHATFRPRGSGAGWSSRGRAGGVELPRPCPRLRPLSAPSCKIFHIFDDLAHDLTLLVLVLVLAAPLSHFAFCFGGR